MGALAARRLLRRCATRNVTPLPESTVGVGGFPALAQPQPTQRWAMPPCVVPPTETSHGGKRSGW